ncbi:MAG: DUF4783 domain-containing protein [Cytophagaceae bacterium]|nr:DUF4783 domain-containing protein [Cytophagaceae bacterium]MBL0300856.1 DUF4783 domain-containing protein [Cytophagaceae bacterium]MBL0327799.1 DUF4783 domain-containing protein [Cytophagaceae bacterium]
MKYIVGLIAIVTLIGTSSYRERKLNVNDISSIVGQSFRTGSSEQLVGCLDKEIELIIDGDRVEYQNIPAQKAQLILNSFFKKNPPVSFSYVYQGNNSAELKYCIGNYHSKKSDYLVYMLIKKTKGDKYLVNTLQLKKS